MSDCTCGGSVLSALTCERCAENDTEQEYRAYFDGGVDVRDVLVVVALVLFVYWLIYSGATS